MEHMVITPCLGVKNLEAGGSPIAARFVAAYPSEYRICNQRTAHSTKSASSRAHIRKLEVTWTEEPARPTIPTGFSLRPLNGQQEVDA